MVKLAIEAYLFEREESCPQFGDEIQRTRHGEAKKVLTSERASVACSRSCQAGY
jgi:hypothetical protein